ncbi:MAG: TM0996/MTH895 family glutaredoxin-like protein [Phycisphaerales bacterium]|nr:TM0996/MTH895 family glutaredoxin-like protein [Phycisphaerales bacterium]MCB9863651.1 TM0996/MTH895 family glutaredoxin-like protein [Phycisphaerales bacterium]
MKIEVLGTGCTKCRLLETAAKAAADRLGVSYSIDHVTDINKITEYGVMMTPALVIDGKVRVVGRVPNDAELAKLLQG